MPTITDDKRIRGIKKKRNPGRFPFFFLFLFSLIIFYLDYSIQPSPFRNFLKRHIYYNRMAPAAVTGQQVNDLATSLKQSKLSNVVEGVISYSALAAKAQEIAAAEKENENSYDWEFLRPAHPEIKWEPIGKIEYSDRALATKQATRETNLAGVFDDSDYPNLYAKASKVVHLTHKTGTILYGVQLNELNDIEKDELALLIARRVVVYFKHQDNLTVQQQLDIGEYYGTLHRHATTGLPKGFDPKDDSTKYLDQVHVIWADAKRVPRSYAAFPSTFLWHSDVTYEVQPPAYTSLKLLTAPTTGGDTLWISGYDLYDQLSPGLKQYAETHSALHSAVEQANDATRNGTFVRRDPIITEHPLVRVHPVTGWKALFVNPGFTRSIVGVPKGESDAILRYFFELIATSQASTVRFKWDKNDVAYWDNRVAVHSATYGFYPERRHGIRVTTHGEVPRYDDKGHSQQEDIDELLKITRDNDGSKGGNYND